MTGHSNSSRDHPEHGLISNEEVTGTAQVAKRISVSNLSQEAHDARETVYTSQLATLFIMVNVTIGVGLLTMPYAMQTAGIITSMIAQLIFLTQIIISCIMCIELTIESEVASYHDIIKRHCHEYAYHFTRVFILLIVFGTTVAYMVTVGDQADRLFASLYGPTFCNTWYMNRRFVMVLVAILAIEPLCSARTVDFLKYASFLGVASICFISFVVVTNFAKTGKVHTVINYYPKSLADIAAIVPVYCLAYQCKFSLVPTVASMDRGQQTKIFITVTIAMILSMIIYSSISVLAILTFGSTIEKDLTQSFPGKSWLTLATIGIVGVKCVLTLPVAFLPARLSMVDILTANSDVFSTLGEPARRISVTLVFMNIALLTAILMPDILIVVNLLGTLAVMFIFTLPAMAYLSLVKQNRLEWQRVTGVDIEMPIYTSKDKVKRCASFSLIILGVIITGVVFCESVKGIISSEPNKTICHS